MVIVNYDVGGCSYGKFNAGNITKIYTDVEIVTKGVFVRMDTDYEGNYGAVCLRMSREELGELISKLITIRNYYDNLLIRGAIR